MHDTGVTVELIATCITANVTNRKPKDKVAVKCYPNPKVENTKRTVHDYTFNKQNKGILGAIQLQCKCFTIRCFRLRSRRGPATISVNLVHLFNCMHMHLRNIASSSSYYSAQNNRLIGK
jgi:hypothetical protein